ncbi:hypothetical protein [Neorhodopirellula pilleata]|uniref:Chromosome partition protein Smc n=1 Tax=Neorhodopirellula pilleata TaxID=2714738 RepID=A0A5C6ARD2_9BACT|nr:hypothetical protein [Neorhodopirellula pilleata]TWU01552.1 hypothetical protein Pla100_12870 [Neorhodopirellula pilleata]
MTSEILAKVDSARRRLILGRFGRTFAITAFVAMLVSTVAIAAMAVVPLERLTGFMQMESGGVTPQNWIAFWLIGTLAIALLFSVLDTWYHAPSRLDVAAEVDRRFGLRERLSSTLAVTQADSSAADSRSAKSPLSPSPFADALTADASSRAAKLHIADQFPLRATKNAWMPLSLVPILAAMILVVEPASLVDQPAAANVDASEVRQVKTAAADLKKRLEQQRKAADEKGLKEASELFQKMERQLDQITKSQSLSRKDALIQLNELKDQIQERKDRIGSPEQLKQMLSQMKGIEGGPAEKIADQIQKGDFGKAAEEMKRLADKIKKGELSDQEKKKLAEQIEKLGDQLKKATEQHEQAKQELREKIEQAKKEGRSEDAAKMQQKLNQAEAADAQMKQMQQMSQAMQSAADAMQQGDSQAAADALSEMSDELGDMQAAMSELEDLQSALDDLSQSKNQMGCKSCNGDGCQNCMGNGQGEGDKPGNGMGKGAGKGDRPEEETDTNAYDTQVRGDVKRGKAIIAGFADGPNRKGVTREEIQSVIEAAISEDSDPLEDQVLPREEREQTRQYFDRLREGS